MKQALTTVTNHLRRTSHTRELLTWIYPFCTRALLALTCHTSTYTPGDMTHHKRDAAVVHVTAANITPLSTRVHIFRSRGDIQINHIRKVRRHNESPRGENNSHANKCARNFFCIFKKMIYILENSWTLCIYNA